MTVTIYQVKDKQYSIIQIIMFGFGLMLLLTACSNKHAEWQHPDKLKDTWHADSLKCKYFAKTQLARQIDIENDANFDNKADLQIQFEKHDAVKKYNSHYTHCITDKGYYQISDE
tara:strand:- start:1066 stop:1410 length:345 start_codon:yes stop_codon:yes gene_type:complete